MKPEFIVSTAILTALALLSGLRAGGFDYDNYLLAINLINYQSDLAEKLLVTKDFMFLVMVESSRVISQKPETTFLTIAITSTALKLITIYRSINYPIFFALFYSTLIAPGLDFAAIRSGLAISFLALAISFYGSHKARNSLAASSVLSHLSLAPAVILMHRAFSEIALKRIEITIPLISILAFFCAGLVSSFSRASIYIGNSSTFFGFILPALSLLSQLIFTKYCLIRSERNIFGEKAITISICLASMALGLNADFVTISHRLLEISNTIFFMGVCSQPIKEPRAWILSITILAIPLTYRCISLGLWDAIRIPFTGY